MVDVVHGLTDRVGDAWALVARERRRLALAQVRRALPEVGEAEAERIVSAMFRHLAALPVEALLATPRVVDEARMALGVAGVMTTEGRGYVLDALEQGRGALLLGAHLGHFELALYAESARGMPLTVLTKRLRTSWADRLWQGLRARHGVQTLDDDNSLAGVLRALGENRCVAVALDQHANAEHAVVTTFFGRPAATHRALALLSARADAPVIPALTRRDAPGQHTLAFGPPIRFERLAGEPHREALRRHTQRYTEVVEQAIRANPEQWTWLHRRWKIDARAKAPRSARPRPGRGEE